MFAKIIADSLNSYNDRITTFFICIPYIYLSDFKQQGINISYKIMKKHYKPVLDNPLDENRWSSGIDLINSISMKVNMINLALSYVSCIMTSTKWSAFLHNIYDSTLTNDYVYSKEFVDLIEIIENLYLENASNVRKLKEDEWHVSNRVREVAATVAKNKNISYIDVLIRYQYYSYYNININLSGTIQYEDTKYLFSKTFHESNKEVYNHIVKVPIEYNYLTNGNFDSIWDSKSGKIVKGYNTMYDSYLCLFDILNKKREDISFK